MTEYWKGPSEPCPDHWNYYQGLSQDMIREQQGDFLT